MQSNESENDLLLTLDPISGHIVATFSIGLILQFRGISALRAFACSLIEEANRLDNYLVSVSLPKKRRGNIPPRYAKKAILDWESDLDEGSTNSNMD